MQGGSCGVTFRTPGRTGEQSSSSWVPSRTNRVMALGYPPGHQLVQMCRAAGLGCPMGHQVALMCRVAAQRIPTGGLLEHSTDHWVRDY